MKRILLNAVTATATSDADFSLERRINRTYQATVVGTGAVSATVIIEGSNDEVGYLTLGTITLSGTTSASDGFVSEAAWAYVRARVTAVSGTSAAVTVSLGV